MKRHEMLVSFERSYSANNYDKWDNTCVFLVFQILKINGNMYLTMIANKVSLVITAYAYAFVFLFIYFV